MVSVILAGEAFRIVAEVDSAERFAVGTEFVEALEIDLVAPLDQISIIVEHFL